MASKRFNRRGFLKDSVAFAGLAAVQGQPERAARLWSAAEALLESIGAPLKFFHQRPDRLTRHYLSRTRGD